MSQAPLRILVLDGGDIRALSQMEILKAIMSRVEYNLKFTVEILPCKYFHLMTGVGPGGVFAAFLGILGMPIEEAQDEFIKLYKFVFDEEKDDRVARSLKLEEFLKDLLVRKGLEADMLLQQTEKCDAICNVLLGTSPAVDLRVFKPLRSYKSQDSPNKFTLVEALRATWDADSKSFTPVYVGEEGRKVKYVGCSIAFNNPTRKIVEEASRLYTGLRRVACIVSLGSGGSPTTSIDLAEGSTSEHKLAQVASAIPDHTITELQRQWGNTNVYYRFSDNFNIQEPVDPGAVIGSVESYIIRETVQLDRCADAVTSNLSRVTMDDLCHAPTRMPIVMPELPHLSAYFLNRPGVIKKMNGIFAQRNTGTGKVMVISGMGGIGKTQIVRKFASDHANEFSFILSIDATSQATIEADLVSGVSALVGSKSVTTSNEALNILSGAQDHSFRNCMVVYDNADDPELKLGEFIPKGGHGYVIITTRNQTLQGLAPAAYMELEVMSENEAKNLLLKIGVPRETSEDDMARATIIVEELGYLPLAIVQAGCYIKAHRCMDTYLDQFKSSRKSLLAHEMGQQLDKSHRAVYAALNITHNALSPKAKQMLQILSFLRPMRISIRFILWVAKRRFSLRLPDYLPRQAAHESATRLLTWIFSPSNPWTEFDTRVLIEELQRYSLVTLTENPETLHFHRLVFAWIQDQLMQTTECATFLSTTTCLLLAGTHEGDQEVADDIVPHVYTLSVSPVWNRLHTNDRAAFIGVLRSHGDARDLVGHWKEIQSDVVTAYGADDHRTSEVELQLADAYWRNEKYEEASHLEERVVQLRTTRLGCGHPSTLSAIARQALGHFTNGDFNLALQLQRDVLKSRSKADPINQEDVARAMEDLAETYIVMRHFGDAKDLLIKARMIWESIYGADHWSVSRILENLKGLEDPEVLDSDVEILDHISFEDEEYEGDAYEGWRPWRDPNDIWWPTPATPLDGLGYYEHKAKVNASQGYYEEAQVYREIVLRVRGDKQGYDHFDTIGAIELLAQVYELRKKFEDAGMLRLWGAKCVIDAIRRSYRVARPDTLSAAQAIVSIYEWQHLKYPKDLQKLRVINIIKLEAAKGLLEAMRGNHYPSNVEVSRALSTLVSHCNLPNISPMGLRRARRILAMLLVVDHQLGLVNACQASNFVEKFHLLDMVIQTLENVVNSQSLTSSTRQAPIDYRTDNGFILTTTDQIALYFPLLPECKTRFDAMGEEDQEIFLSCRPSPGIQGALITCLVHDRNHHLEGNEHFKFKFHQCGIRNQFWHHEDELKRHNTQLHPKTALALFPVREGSLAQPSAMPYGQRDEEAHSQYNNGRDLSHSVPSSPELQHNTRYSPLLSTAGGGYGHQRAHSQALYNPQPSKPLQMAFSPIYQGHMWEHTGTPSQSHTLGQFGPIQPDPNATPDDTWQTYPDYYSNDYAMMPQQSWPVVRPQTTWMSDTPYEPPFSVQSSYLESGLKYYNIQHHTGPSPLANGSLSSLSAYKPPFMPTLYPEVELAPSEVTESEHRGSPSVWWPGRANRLSSARPRVGYRIAGVPSIFN